MIRRPEHDPEINAAAYVSGEMRSRERARFEAHLVACEECWREVTLGGRGRGLVEATRELAPPALRDEIRAAISIAPTRRAPRRVALAAAAVVLIGSLIFGVREVSRSGQPAPIAAAIEAARTETFASRGPATWQAPDRSAEGLHLVMGSEVDLAGLTSDAFMYRNAAGGSVVLFVSQSAFPTALEAAMRGAASMGWDARVDGMTLVCGAHPVNYLVVSEDPSLVGPIEHTVARSRSIHV